MMVLVVPGHVVMGEQGVQERTELPPLRGFSVDQCGICVTYPYHLRVAPIRMSRIQLQREVLSPRILRLVMSFEGAMVLSYGVEL
jgi:hypothetical protein